MAAGGNLGEWFGQFKRRRAIASSCSGCSRLVAAEDGLAATGGVERNGFKLEGGATAGPSQEQGPAQG